MGLKTVAHIRVYVVVRAYVRTRKGWLKTYEGSHFFHNPFWQDQEALQFCTRDDSVDHKKSPYVHFMQCCLHNYGHFLTEGLFATSLTTFICALQGSLNLQCFLTRKSKSHHLNCGILCYIKVCFYITNI